MSDHATSQFGHPDDDVLDLRDYLAVLRRRVWLIVAVVVLVVAAALGFSFTQEPVYSSTARVVVDPNRGEDAALNEAIFGNRELETQRELVTSLPVASRAAALLGDGRAPENLQDNVSVTLLNETQILQISANGESAEQAANTAQAFATAYLNFRTDQALENVLRARDALDQREAATRERLDELERMLRTATGSDLTSLELEQQQLATELATLTAQRSTLSGNEVFAAAGGQIVQPAEPNQTPVSPRPIRTGVLALVLGLMLGVGVAFLRDFLDDVIRDESDAERASGHAVIGRIPSSQEEHDGRLALVVDPRSSASEAYRALRTNLRFLTMNTDKRSVLITSALPGEGKTTVACNVAVAIANGGKRVVLVGADLRRPTVTTRFAITDPHGLTEVLIGESTLMDALVDVGVKNLRVLPAGVLPPNPAELLASERMGAVMADLDQIAEVVIYDGPPVLAVADALELSPRVGAVAMVINAGASKRGAVHQAVDRLEAVHAPLSGTVLNNVDPEGGYYYGYGGYGGYGPEPEDEQPKKTRPGRRAKDEPAPTGTFTAKSEAEKVR